MAQRTTITIDKTEEIVSVNLGNPHCEAEVLIQENSDDVAIALTPQTENVAIDCVSLANDVDLNVSETVNDVLIKVFDNNSTSIFKGIAGEAIEPFRLVYMGAGDALFKSYNNDAAIPSHHWPLP